MTDIELVRKYIDLIGATITIILGLQSVANGSCIYLGFFSEHYSAGQL
jgi:hypothetical protein